MIGWDGLVIGSGYVLVKGCEWMKWGRGCDWMGQGRRLTAMSWAGIGREVSVVIGHDWVGLCQGL